MGNEVLLYAPNIVGYVRIILVSIAFLLFEHPEWFAVLYTISITLDGLDGYLARKLNQCSKFGAWFDVVIDLYSRGFLWCALFRIGYLVVFLEWLAFVCTHSRGENWKVPDDKFPKLVKLVMANGFRTPIGFLAVWSLHLLPLWMYGYESRLFRDIALPMGLQLAGIAVLAIGWTICVYVELFYIIEYAGRLIRSDSAKDASSSLTRSDNNTNNQIRKVKKYTQ